MTTDQMPELPKQHEELRAHWRCDSCDGKGHMGHMRHMGEFQPPEYWPCGHCDGAGYVSCEAFTSDQMREYARAAIEAHGRQGEAAEDAKYCKDCRATGLSHCSDPLHCGGPWSKKQPNGGSNV